VKSRRKLLGTRVEHLVSDLSLKLSLLCSGGVMAEYAGVMLDYSVKMGIFTLKIAAKSIESHPLRHALRPFVRSPLLSSL